MDFRLMTKKETEESKGCGFLEFDNAGSMRVCTSSTYVPVHVVPNVYQGLLYPLL